MKTSDIVYAIDGAKYVQYNDNTNLFYVWNGSLIINVYASDFESVDTIMFMERPQGDLDEIIAEVQDLIAIHNDGWFDV